VERLYAESPTIWIASPGTWIGLIRWPVWQDVFGTEQGDLREMLRRQIDQCKGVLHLVGQCYGAEPPTPDEQFGRVSYTQFEALYARGRGMNVWYFVLDKDFPTDPHEPEPEELAKLQADCRQRTQADTHLFHPLSTQEALEACVLKMRKEFRGAWGSARRWPAAVIGLLVLSIALVVWLVIAEKWHRPPNPNTEERANAALVSKDYAAGESGHPRVSGGQGGRNGVVVQALSGRRAR
jgi:hypothetical protein